MGAIVASVSALRGGPVKETPRLTPPDASCFKKANTVDVCEQEASSDGTGNCVWCQTKGDDGICISRANARDVVEIMRIPCPNYTDPREESPTADTWVVTPMLKIVGAFNATTKDNPLIPMGTPDPYVPPE